MGFYSKNKILEVYYIKKQKKAATKYANIKKK